MNQQEVATINNNWSVKDKHSGETEEVKELIHNIMETLNKLDEATKKQAI